MSQPADPRRDQRWAWGCVVLILAGTVLAQFLGYGIAVALGYNVPEAADPPLGAALLISLPALVVAAAPGVGAAFFGIRSRQVGGYLAAGIGVLSAVFWVVITVMGLLGRA